MHQQLPKRFVTRWIRDQMDFGAEVTELVRGDFYSDVPEHRPLDGNPQCCGHSRLPFPGHKQPIRSPAGHGRCDLVAVGIESIREVQRQLELGRLLVLGFVFSDHDKRRFALTLRPRREAWLGEWPQKRNAYRGAALTLDRLHPPQSNRNVGFFVV
jgi:hypothetical protein